MIARIVYRMLKDKVEYEAMRAAEYEQRYREREIRYLKRKAAKLGFIVSVPSPIAQAVS